MKEEDIVQWWDEGRGQSSMEKATKEEGRVQWTEEGKEGEGRSSTVG